MSRYQYDEGYVRTLLDKLSGKKEDNIKVFAEVHEVEVDASNQGLYRSPDLVSILTEAVNQKNELAKIPENLETKVGISKTKVAYERTKEVGRNLYSASSYLAKKALIHFRYLIYGALPGKIQDKLAKKHNEDPTNYSIANSSTALLSSLGLLFYGAAVPGVIPTVIGFGLVLSEVTRMAYGSIKFSKTSKDSPAGEPLVTIPYHILMSPYNAGKSIKKIYSRKKLELEAAELPRLPTNTRGPE